MVGGGDAGGFRMVESVESGHGDHSLQVAKRTLKRDGETQDDVDARILDAVRAFVPA